MEFFDGMAQKTKNISEIMKLTAAVSSEKERQEKIYRELGETYYKVYGDRAESELMEMCTQIREDFLIGVLLLYWRKIMKKRFLHSKGLWYARHADMKSAFILISAIIVDIR